MASPTIDGLATATSGIVGVAGTITVNLTTANAGDLIYCVAVSTVIPGFVPALSAPTDTATLTWTLRSSNTGTTTQPMVVNTVIYTAPAPAALTSDAISINYDPTDHVCMAAFGVTGLHSNTDAFDSNASAPTTSFAAGGGGGTTTYSTDQPDDLLLAFLGNADSGITTAPTGWTLETNINETGSGAAYGKLSVFKLSVSATQSSQTVTVPERGCWFYDAVTGDAKAVAAYQTFVTCF